MITAHSKVMLWLPWGSWTTLLTQHWPTWVYNTTLHHIYEVEKQVEQILNQTVAYLHIQHTQSNVNTIFSRFQLCLAICSTWEKRKICLLWEIVVWCLAGSIQLVYGFKFIIVFLPVEPENNPDEKCETEWKHESASPKTKTDNKSTKMLHRV